MKEGRRKAQGRKIFGDKGCVSAQVLFVYRLLTSLVTVYNVDHVTVYNVDLSLNMSLPASFPMFPPSVPPSLRPSVPLSVPLSLPQSLSPFLLPNFFLLVSGLGLVQGFASPRQHPHAYRATRMFLADHQPNGGDAGLYVHPGDDSGHVRLRLFACLLRLASLIPSGRGMPVRSWPQGYTTVARPPACERRQHWLVRTESDIRIL